MVILELRMISGDLASWAITKFMHALFINIIIEYMKEIQF